MEQILQARAANSAAQHMIYIKIVILHFLLTEQNNAPRKPHIIQATILTMGLGGSNPFNL